MITMIYVDANNQVLGRLASSVAKLLMGGEAVSVVNAEKAVVIGNPKAILESYGEKRERGDPYHGPFYPKKPGLILRRSIRGMLPYKAPRGMEAFKRLKVFISVPEDLKDKQFRELKGTANKGEFKSITIGRLADTI